MRDYELLGRRLMAICEAHGLLTPGWKQLEDDPASAAIWLNGAPLPRVTPYADPEPKSSHPAHDVRDS